jgi:hypothetical protein
MGFCKKKKTHGITVFSVGIHENNNKEVKSKTNKRKRSRLSVESNNWNKTAELAKEIRIHYLSIDNQCQNKLSPATQQKEREMLSEVS